MIIFELDVFVTRPLTRKAVPAWPTNRRPAAGGAKTPPAGTPDGSGRAARRCDFEHAVPYDKGGKTCGCNGGCRCRRDHRVKQSPGWKVTQPMPGYHQWTTPSGRTYTTEPMRYPI